MRGRGTCQTVVTALLCLLSSSEWSQACLQLLQQFQYSCRQLTLPCFVAAEAPPTQLGCPAYRKQDTLYLELTGPVIRPGLLVTSDLGKANIHFGQVGTGEWE